MYVYMFVCIYQTPSYFFDTFSPRKPSTGVYPKEITVAEFYDLILLNLNVAYNSEKEENHLSVE